MWDILLHMNVSPTVASAKIYLVDADPSMHAWVSRLFAALPTPVRTYASAEAFLSEVSADACGCLIVELKLPGMDGLALMAQLQHRGIGLPVIMLATDSDVPTAVAAMRLGALDFIDKPVVDRVLFNRVRQVLALAQGSSASKPNVESANSVPCATRIAGASEMHRHADAHHRSGDQPLTEAGQPDSLATPSMPRARNHSPRVSAAMSG